VHAGKSKKISNFLRTTVLNGKYESTMHPYHGEISILRITDNNVSMIKIMIFITFFMYNYYV